MFWLNNPSILLHENIDIYDPINRLNMLFKFSIIISIFLVLISKDLRFFLLMIIIGIFTVLIKFKYDREQFTKFVGTYKIDKVDNKLCSAPTDNNPFMNPNISDLNFNPHRFEACNVDLSMNKINYNFNKNFFKNPNDLYGRESSMRQFYTVPNTTIPNKQTELAKWLYDGGLSCKQGNDERCINNIGLHRLDLSINN